MKNTSPIPSVDEVLRAPTGQLALARFGRQATLAAVRAGLADLRLVMTSSPAGKLPDRSQSTAAIAERALATLEAGEVPNLRRVFNLTGTILHTNLGRAVLPEEAIAAAADAMRYPGTVEFDLATGARGERDDIVRGLVCEMTGAEDAITVNNNAAAVLLVLNTLALGKESVVSRGELIEIGGSFRMPAIMERAGTRLREVGTTNRTHDRDYEAAIGPETGLLLKVHTSNYLIQGFTKEVPTAELAGIGHAHHVPVVDDLGSGTLVDLARYGLKRERTVMDALADGADLVTFSGDKLLGGPQAGFIVGRRDLVQACAKNPIKRAVRLDKIRLAALEATLRLYRDPDTLAQKLPTLRMLARAQDDVRTSAEAWAPRLAAVVGPHGWCVNVREVESQIGSGALPLETMPSAGLAIAPANPKDGGHRLDTLAASFRSLPIPVIGRIEQGAIIFDLRALEDDTAFGGQLAKLTQLIS